LYDVVKELDLSEDKDQRILQDELIMLTSAVAIKAGIDKVVLRRVAAYDEKNNKGIGIITNQLK
jgi:hypothetical protein